jgi:hypothetical protein
MNEKRLKKTQEGISAPLDVNYHVSSTSMKALLAIEHERLIGAVFESVKGR